jgi:DNA-binding MarR family transcriptional regulator
VGEDDHLRNAIAGLDELILSLGQRILTYFASRSADFTIKEMFLIDVLGSRESATMSELAQILSVPLTTMTSMVTRLVKRGYLDRFRTEEDRRIVLVSLSRKGHDIFREHRHEYIRTVSEVLGDLTEEEQRTILAFIGQVLTAMSSTGSSGNDWANLGRAGCGPVDPSHVKCKDAGCS